MLKFVTAVVVSLVFTACTFFDSNKNTQAIARVNSDYLYAADIANLVPPGISKEDSIVIVRSFIDRWASKKLLIKVAEVNLNKSKKAEFYTLIQQYKIDLYTKAYLEEIVKRTADTVISEIELRNYYNENKENYYNFLN